MCSIHADPPTAQPGDVAVKPSDWRPIDTAPRNGDSILVYFDCASVPIVHIAFWDDGEFWEMQKMKSREEATGWWSYTRGSVTQEKLDGYRTPTHWMPFDAPGKLAAHPRKREAE